MNSLPSKLPLKRSTVARVFQGGLAMLEGKIEFMRNRHFGKPPKQPDKAFHEQFDHMIVVRGRPKMHPRSILLTWQQASNFVPRYRQSLEQAFVSGHADAYLQRHKIMYEPPNVPRALLLARKKALDQMRPLLDAVRLAKAMRNSLPGETHRAAGAAYLQALKNASQIERAVTVIRKLEPPGRKINALLAVEQALSHRPVAPVRWDFARLMRDFFAELQAMRAAPTTKARERTLARLEIFFEGYNFSDSNNERSREVRAAMLLARQLGSGPHLSDLSAQLKTFLEKPDWAGPFADAIKLANKIPLYVLDEYDASTREFNVMHHIGKPEASQDLWALYHVECVAGAKVCQPATGHYVLPYEDEAKKELEAYRDSVLARIPWSSVLLQTWLHRLSRVISARELRELRAGLRSLPSRATGLRVLRVVMRDREPLLVAKIMRQFFEAARAMHAEGQKGGDARTVSAATGKQFLEHTLTRLGLKLRRADQPMSVGWLVRVTDAVSAEAAVSPELREILLREVPAGHPLFTHRDLVIALGYHEMMHVLRAESGQVSPFARLSTGIREALAYEEGMATLLERLRERGRVSRARTTGAIHYWAAALALKNKAPRLERPLFSWQDIYDQVAALGIPDEIAFETVRRLIRGTDGKRRPKNINLRDTVYFRGVQLIEEWIPESFGHALNTLVWRRHFKSAPLTASVLRQIAAFIRKEAGTERFRAYAAQAILDLLNELMVGKITPDFLREMRRRGDYHEPLFILAER